MTNYTSSLFEQVFGSSSAPLAPQSDATSEALDLLVAIEATIFYNGQGNRQAQDRLHAVIQKLTTALCKRHGV